MTWVILYESYYMSHFIRRFMAKDFSNHGFEESRSTFSPMSPVMSGMTGPNIPSP